MITNSSRVFKVESVNSTSQFDHVSQLRFSSIVNLTSKIQTVLILSRLSDSVQCRRGSFFQTHALYLRLRTSWGVNTR